MQKTIRGTLIKNVIAVPTTTQVTTMVIGLRIPTSDDSSSFINAMLTSPVVVDLYAKFVYLLCTVCFSLKIIYIDPHQICAG